MEAQYGAYGQQPFYPSTIRAFSMIAKEEGVVRGLWRGVGVCVARVFVERVAARDVRCRKAVFVG